MGGSEDDEILTKYKEIEVLSSDLQMKIKKDPIKSQKVKETKSSRRNEIFEKQKL